ncbi:Omp28-related outer membrane protein [Bacteroidales bacterium OttesenSCG-928-M11]|nr:Omp28-related outer membrane protein [Bacteroidales bacterium OttesenSCG-928-M11]
MKYLSLLILSLAFSLGMNAQITVAPMDNSIELQASMAASGSIDVGHCGHSIDASFGIGSPSIKVGTVLSSETISKYAGNSITKLKIGTGAATFTNSKLFISKSIGGEEIYVQDISLSASSWNEVDLTTPYLIKEGESLFIGYESTAPERYPIGYSNITHPDCGYVLFQGNWMSLLEGLGDNNTLSLLAVVEGDKLPENEITLSSISAPNKIEINDEFTFFGIVQNQGIEPINSFEFSYAIGDGEFVTKKIENITIQKKGKYEFSTKVKGLEIGANTLTMKVSNPNDVADFYSKDNELTYKVTGYDASNNKETRKVLLEYFTTTHCGNCPPAQTRWKSALSGLEDNVIWVSHHAGFYTDTYTISASEDYLWFFNGGAYAPASMLDRTNLYAYGSGAEKTPVFFPSGVSLQKSLVNQQLNTPPFVKIAITGEYNVESKSLSLTINSNKIEGMPLGNNPVLNIFLTEDGLVGTQTGASGKYTHDHVIRKVVTPAWGEKVSFSEDGSHTKSYTTAIPSDWKVENMKVVAFISNYDSTDPNNCEVYNAEFVTFGNITSLEDINNESLYDNIYTNNGTIYITTDQIGKATIELYDSTGKLVQNLNTVLNSEEISIQTSGLNGVYILKICTGNGNVIKKIVL